MFAILEVVSGPDMGRKFSVDEGQVLVIGSGRHTHDKLTDPEVSRTHCQVELRDGQAVLSDGPSPNGTWFQGQKVSRRILVAGDVFQVGQTCIRFKWSDLDEYTTLYNIEQEGRPGEPPPAP